MILTHDRGTSVGMIALDLLAESQQHLPDQAILTNANIHLPLANLTAFRSALLDPATARDTARATTPELLAAGLGASTFLPRPGRSTIPRSLPWQLVSPITTGSLCCPTRLNTSTNALPAKRLGWKHFPAIT
jgi:hypothetical protein